MTVAPQPKSPQALMIDALIWYGPDRMRELIIRHLDPGRQLRIEAELNFAKWSPMQLAMELETQIRAHGLLEQAVRGMRELQSDAPNLEGLAVALGVAPPGQTSPAGRSVPDAIRDEAISFSAVFADRRPQFRCLSAYKDLHDQLHTLQGMEEGIRLAAGRFRNRPDQPKELLEVAAALTDLAVKARRNYEALKKPRRVGKWLPAFEGAAGELRRAAENNDTTPVAAQVETLQGLPGQYLSDLNIALLESIEQLGLDELAERMGTILAGLTSQGSAASDFTAALSFTLGQFRDSCSKLDRVMADHDACQEFENVVMLAVSNRGAIPPAQIPGWAKARHQLAAVVPEPGDVRAAQAAQAAERFEAAAAGGDAQAAARELAQLLVMFRPLFNEIDKKLLALTDRLVQSAAYLDVQLRNAANVTH
jgi:hypothetical protein